MTLKILFYLPAILFVISGLPQILKLLKTKSSNDISLQMYLITATAISIVVVDAYLSHNNSILVSNLFSLASVVVTTFLIIYYRKNKNI